MNSTGRWMVCTAMIGMLALCATTVGLAFAGATFLAFLSGAGAFFFSLCALVIAGGALHAARKEALETSITRGLADVDAAFDRARKNLRRDPDGTKR